GRPHWRDWLCPDLVSSRHGGAHTARGRRDDPAWASLATNHPIPFHHSPRPAACFFRAPATSGLERDKAGGFRAWRPDLLSSLRLYASAPALRPWKGESQCGRTHHAGLCAWHASRAHFALGRVELRPRRFPKILHAFCRRGRRAAWPDEYSIGLRTDCSRTC